MQVVMLDSVALAHGAYKQGQVYDLAEARAKKLIEKGLAESLKQKEIRLPVKRRTATTK